jgi:hypothetical protein
VLCAVPFFLTRLGEAWLIDKKTEWSDVTSGMAVPW